MDDVPTLWQEVLASQAIRAVRGARLIGTQLPESVARRVEMLVAENDCSKACNALLSNPPLEPTEDLLAVMSGLHPRNSCTFDTSNLEDRLERIPEFTGAEVNEAMLSFKRSSSAGLSGLRPGHILSLLDSKNAKCLLHILGVLASRLANFELPPELAPYLAGASLIAIQKPAGGVRPVACGDAIRRLTSKLMLKRVLPLVSPKLLPTQLGISVPAIIFHRVASQIANSTDDQKTFLVLDLKNAFNCIDRSCIMEAVMKYAPSLALFPQDFVLASSSLPLSKESNRAIP